MNSFYSVVQIEFLVFELQVEFANQWRHSLNLCIFAVMGEFIVLALVVYVKEAWKPDRCKNNNNNLAIIHEKIIISYLVITHEKIT